MNKETKKPDIIIILGGGTNGTLTPVLYTKERLEAFMKMHKRVHNTPVIVSGGYSMWFSRRPKYTEADVMKNYLSKRGIPSRLILTEKRSRDTVGNAYCSKQIVKRMPYVKNILVVTTKGHTGRSRLIFRKVFGRRHHLDFLEVPTKYSSFRDNPGRKDYENYLKNIHKKILGKCRDGDDKQIIKILQKFHPAFSKTKEARDIRRAIVAAKQKYLGYARLENTNEIVYKAGKINTA